MKKEIILVKVGEIALKGLNKKAFEDVLIKNIKRRLSHIGRFTIKSAQSTIYITPLDEDIDLDDVEKSISTVFGIATYSKACIAPKSIEDIFNMTKEYLYDVLSTSKTFKVEAKRSDKQFPLKSPEICMELGGLILNEFSNLKVDVHNPDTTVVIEVRDYGAYIRGQAKKGAGGIPVGTGGKASILISGGIDSPVAAYMLAKRGIELTAIHFASPPYTSIRAEQKVKDLLNIVSQYSGRMIMYTIPFTKIQEEIRKNCPEELFTIVMRRFMMKIAEIISIKEDCKALITGESLGQVASQTISAIACTDEICNIPVFRPLIGMDKEEIITIARKIGTFETSILPYEDCCTVFTPKHPRTKPNIKYVKQAYDKLDSDALIAEAVNSLKTIKIGY